jgi:hypothetical protein
VPRGAVEGDGGDGRGEVEEGEGGHDTFENVSQRGYWGVAGKDGVNRVGRGE